MHIVLTGAAGFIGSALMQRLLSDGHSVLGIDDLSTGQIENIACAAGNPHLTFVRGGVTEDPAREAMSCSGAEVFLHLAAHMDVRNSVLDPISDARSNILGCLAVLESAREAGARNVVFASSGGTIYGDHKRLPINESVRPDPHSPYAASKVCGEVYLTVYRHLYNLPSTILALGNVYGPGQNPYGETGVVSIFASALLEGRPTTILGTGDATRDYVYIDDVVEAFVLAASSTGRGMRLNIGTGRETSVRDLHRVIAAAVGRPDQPTFLPARAGELQRVALDCAAAGNVLGWHARVGLEDGILKTVTWLRNANPRAKTAAEPVHASR
jgi:UDP-glucose 4-epimerase